MSTTAALIAAGHGCAVAKHGNRSATGLSGSADVLEALGVRIDLKPDAVARCINEVGFGFMFAPAHHGATRFVVPVRKELAVRTIFNFLGPLTNPAGAKRQVIGVSDPNFLEPIAGALARLGADKALVVSSSDGLDEMSTSSTTRVVEVDGEDVRAYEVAPEDVGIARAEPDALQRRHDRTSTPTTRGGSSPASTARRATSPCSTRAPRSTSPAPWTRWRRACAPRRPRSTTAAPRRRWKPCEPHEGAGARMSVLDRIVDDTRDEVKRRKKEVPIKELKKLIEVAAGRLAAVQRGADPAGRVA